MARRNRNNKPGFGKAAGGNSAPRSNPAPPPLAARESAVDLAAEARIATARQARKGIAGRIGGGGAVPGTGTARKLTAADLAGMAAAQTPWSINFLLGEARYSEEAFNSAAQDIATHDRWGYYPDRKVRYDVFWGHYEGNVYRSIHRWATALKVDRGLYAHTRTIFSPAYRIGEFWAGHLWGGPLDPEAGDGVGVPSSLPIAVPEDANKADELRDAIALVWEYSLWQSKKDVVTRTGAVKGDVAMLVHDDGESVSIRVVDPGTIVDVRRDSRGNVKEYVLQEWRNDPEYDQSTPFGRIKVRYNEWCRKVGGAVVYTTYRNGFPYDWREYPDGTAPEAEVGDTWYVGYDFIPMVFVQHRDMNKGFGWSELQPDFGKMYELDDIASKLSDQVRKIVDCPWYLPGASPADVTIDLDGDLGGPIHGRNDDLDSRQSTPIWYGPEGSEPHPMVAPLDIAAVGQHIKDILEDLERDHPELATDNVGLASSGEARRVAREKVEAMVVQRRAGYDDALVRILQMCISIGAINGYEGYAAFDEGSYDRGDLDFAIGARPVFAVDPSEKQADALSIMGTIKAGVDAGLPIEFAMKLAGLSDEQIQEVVKLMDEKSAKDEAKLAAQQEALMAANYPDGPGQDGSQGGDGQGGPGGNDPNADPNADPKNPADQSGNPGPATSAA